MAIILTINTAFETASVILSFDGEIIAEEQSHSQKTHASFLEPAIKKVCSSAQVDLKMINAVSVVNGPGSYTGLRVGLASAKALCYALKKSLILLNTLDIMAYALKEQSLIKPESFLYCPLIDARRMEVFTALYDKNLTVIKTPFAEILDMHFLEKERENAIIIAGGSGSLKLEEILHSKNIVYINPLFLSKAAVILSMQAYISERFSNVAYSEPFYLKPVYFRK
ncbi:MAG: tRNA (adenosine(37)-N6)-threonylcarbamoyltransferase complex dimerization subunit type 1 TsaB [Parafilimonas sp.]